MDFRSWLSPLIPSFKIFGPVFYQAQQTSVLHQRIGGEQPKMKLRAGPRVFYGISDNASIYGIELGERTAASR
jgi:hypothetical protein